jgi:mannose-6-phosphate isomerase class I
MYDARPTTPLPPGARIHRGAAAWDQIRSAAGGSRALIVLDAYPGVDLAALRAEALRFLPGFDILDVEDAALPVEIREARFADNLTDDRVLGVLSHATIEQLYDPAAVAALQGRLRARSRPTVLLGWGAGFVGAEADVLVVVDLARWEIQQRYRAGASNWRADNGDEDILRKFKRGYFLEWRIADRHKLRLLPHADFVIDADDPNELRLLDGDSFRTATAGLARRPFRLVPYFDPGVWGGQWMNSTLELGRPEANLAWSFDGVPEENSVLFSDGDSTFESPAQNLVLLHPRELLGELTFARFGAEFPIRFDFLDTMGGGNLSLQVHPLTEYMRDRFGMAYTQDESYYLLDAAEDATVYLGLKTGVDRVAMERDLRAAQQGGPAFPVEQYVNAFPAAKHDHFSIPAGTVHCSGANSMVLEISATPYIFTFKMWDWGRVGLDGIPRPVHLDHALANIQWDRQTEWVEENLAVPPRDIAQGNGWREERTGLHEFEFIEVRRHWFTGPVAHDTGGTVNVLNLVEGAEAIVESPTDAFPPFVVHYAETFIVPAEVGAYTVTPHGDGAGHELATVKASVRGTQRHGG